MNTSRLALPYIAASQAQKHVTHNEALLRLDDLVHLSVARLDLTSPPLSPTEGQRFIVASPATGLWGGYERHIAVWRGGGWFFYAPKPGWQAYVEQSGDIWRYNGTVWLSSQQTDRLGINGTADQTNRLSVTGVSSLFNGANGSHQIKINKGNAGQTASLLYQNNFSGRAEIGLCGDDRLSFKVSADGAAWSEALMVDQANGAVSLPQMPLALCSPNLLINGDFTINQRGFANGALAQNAYGFDRWKALTAANLSVASGVVTLNSGEIGQPVEAQMWGLQNFAGQRVAISVENLSSDLRVRFGGQEAVISAGTGRRSVSLLVPSGFTAVPTLSLSRATGSGSITFSKVKLEIGAASTPWQARSLSQEEMMCKRYFNRIEGPINVFLYAQASGNYFFLPIMLTTRMRVTPLVTRLIGTSNNIYENNLANIAATPLNPGVIRTSIVSNGAGEAYANITQIDCDAEMI